MVALQQVAKSIGQSVGTWHCWTRKYSFQIFVYQWNIACMCCCYICNQQLLIFFDFVCLQLRCYVFVETSHAAQYYHCLRPGLRLVLAKHAKHTTCIIQGLKFVINNSQPRRYGFTKVHVSQAPNQRSTVTVVTAANAMSRSLQRETLRRQLIGRSTTRRSAPDDVSEGEVHI